MPRRKGKARATPKKIAETHASLHGSTTPEPSSKKRKVDWSTIDQDKTFNGFALNLVRPKASKKAQPSKKQKTIHDNGRATENYKDAPLDANIVQTNPFSESDISNTHYAVEPAAAWESTNRYRKFTSK
jgi:hypothetical protein